MVHHTPEAQTKRLVALGFSLALALGAESCSSTPYSSSSIEPESSEIDAEAAGLEVHSATDPGSAAVDLVEQKPHLIPKPVAMPQPLDVAEVKDQPAEIKAWCRELRRELTAMKWQIDPCPAGVNWKVGGISPLGRTLAYAEFGEARADNSTLILSMIHSDEVTPLYLGLQLAAWMNDPAVAREMAGNRVVIAPLVNPDGFFKRARTRQNSRGVDLNRNFATRDWFPHALNDWKRKYRSDRRRFPGHRPESEPETIFQRDLIRLSQPQKILSIHAPLSMMDYDGPDSGLPLAKFLSDYGKKYLKLRTQLKTLSWQFYPGSLGNYAGRELGIPTMTLELPTADPRRAPGYWKQFEEGARLMIMMKSNDVGRAAR